MRPFFRDNPILWHFAPWKSRGARGRLFWLLVIGGLALPVAAMWLLGEGSPIWLLDPALMQQKNSEGMFNSIARWSGFPIVNIWAWWTALLGVSLLSWVLCIGAVYLLRLNLLRMGLLEQVYLTGLDRNRAAMATVAWGGAMALFILVAAFAFQALYLGAFEPVRLGNLTYRQISATNWQRVPQFELVSFGVGYAFVLLAASMAVWSQALRGALRQTSLPWLDAPRCLASGLFVGVLILLGTALLGVLPRNNYFIYYSSIPGIHFFTLSLVILSAFVGGVMVIVQLRTMGRAAGRICFGPVNPELFVRDDWWESERAHRRDRVFIPRTSVSDWIGQIVVSLAGVALALFILSLVAMNIDLRAMTLQFPYVVALMGIYAPAAVAIFEAIRGPLGNHRPVRGRLIRSVLNGSLPMLLAVAAGLAFFLWIAAGLNTDHRVRTAHLPWVTVAFGVGFGLLAQVLLLPRRGRPGLLIGAGVIALVLLLTPLGVGGLALFGLGLATLCSLPTGLLSVLFQRIHDELPPPDSLADQSLVEAVAPPGGQIGIRSQQGEAEPR
jgi:hypothetical protein